MNRSEGNFQSNGQEIHYCRWQPEANPRAVVLLVHGLAEHCGRYEPLAQRINHENIAVCSLDLPGHGRSTGERCHIDRFSHMHEATNELRNLVAHWHPDVPVFLLGHSMGGLIATNILLQQQDRYAGCILSGAALQSPVKAPWLQVLLLRFISAVAPSTRVLALDPRGVSRDAAVVQNYVDDSLNYTGKLSARLVVEMFTCMQQTLDGAATITLPLLILHGGADTMTAPAGSQVLHDKVASTDKTLNIYDGLYHEIFNEPEGPQILEEVAQWIGTRCRSLQLDLD